jgi:UDP-N-acetylglucosamine 3-dehydrogenase
MLNVVVIGVGNMGKHHVRNYFEMENVNLVAVCDINKELANRVAKKYSCKAYDNYKELLEQEDFQAASIAVPTSLHKKVSLDFIEKRKHVLLEKPIAKTIEEAQDIIRAAREKKVKLLIGHIERFNPAVQKLKELIKKDVLGKLTSIIARRVGVAPPQIQDANVIVDMAVHDIDIINYFVEKPPMKIYSSYGKALIKRREDYAEIFMIYKGGVTGFVQANWITPIKIRNINVTGTKGYAELNYITQELIISKNNYPGNVKTFSDIIQAGKPITMGLPITKSEPLKEELKHFVRCIEKNKKPAVSGEQALHTLRIAIAATKNNHFSDK